MPITVISTSAMNTSIIENRIMNLDENMCNEAFCKQKKLFSLYCDYEIVFIDYYTSTEISPSRRGVWKMKKQ
jgi:hypothetical protein